MKIRPTVSVLLVFALAALLLAAGCDRMDTAAPPAAEVDEPGYRRGKELERQGREPEAIIEFNKVLAKRGLDNSPETHLELGILNQRIDPFTAVFHFQKYRQLRPNPDRDEVARQRDELVKQRIEVAKREFVSTLPGRLTLLDPAAAANPDVAELNNKIRALQDENRRLRDALGGAAAGNAAAANTVFSSAPPASPATVTVAVAAPAAQSQPARAQGQAQQQLQQLQQARPQPQQQQQQTQQASQPRATGRAYTVKKGDSLFSIARQIYGTASNAQVEAIVSANRGILTAGRDTPLREGMVLKLP